MHDGRLHWEHNWLGEERYRVAATAPVAAGRHLLAVEVRVDEEGAFGGGGTATLMIDDAVVAQGRFEQQVGSRFTVQEGFDVGCDTVTPVSDLYASPATFTGTVHTVTFDTSDLTYDEIVTQTRISASTQ